MLLLRSKVSVKHDSHADPEIVLRAVKQSRGVVVNLNHTDIDSIACANVETASKRGRPSRFFVRKI